jgi:ABC-2 type transport system ATP-binding protein
MKAIDVHGLVKRYGDKTVVDKVSMSVEQGEISGFLGPNGSGKTTTIRVMCGLLTPDAGGGTVLGMDLLRDQLQIKREVGYMTQRFSFYEDMSIEENLTFVARLYQLHPVEQVVRDTLENLGLSARRKQLAGRLSGGWKQRLALAACIMHKPKLLLLDEPTAGVDPKARREFWDEIHALSASGVTVLVSTHYMDEAERCHKINYISYGKLLASGTVSGVIENAGLTTMIVEGADAPKVVGLLAGQPGIDQVAPFGNTLHIVGHDAQALKKSVGIAVKGRDVSARLGETSLEDVFIQFMSHSQDNMA